MTLYRPHRSLLSPMATQARQAGSWSLVTGEAFTAWHSFGRAASPTWPYGPSAPDVRYATSVRRLDVAKWARETGRIK